MFMSKQLFTAAPQPKQFIVISDGDHNDLFEIGEQKLLDRIQDFIQTNTQK
jgi:fermentation-respiration switch protein FrsA (DUF1100 family)